MHNIPISSVLRYTPGSGILPQKWYLKSGPSLAKYMWNISPMPLQVMDSEVGQPTWTRCIGLQMTPPCSKFLPTQHSATRPSFTCGQKTLAGSCPKWVCYHIRAEPDLAPTANSSISVLLAPQDETWTEACDVTVQVRLNTKAHNTLFFTLSVHVTVVKNLLPLFCKVAGYLVDFTRAYNGLSPWRPFLISLCKMLNRKGF